MRPLTQREEIEELGDIVSPAIVSTHVPWARLVAHTLHLNRGPPP